jgi:hypothetical protein
LPVQLLRTAAQLESFHVRHDHWPASWAEAGVPALVDPRSALPFRIVPSDRSLTLLPQPDPPRTDEDVAVSLR